MYDNHLNVGLLAMKPVISLCGQCGSSPVAFSTSSQVFTIHALSFWHYLDAGLIILVDVAKLDH